MTVLDQQIRVTSSWSEILLKAAVASIEASWACLEAADKTGLTPNQQQERIIAAKSAARAWKLAGFAWDSAARIPAPGPDTEELGLALKASGQALTLTCALEPGRAHGEAMQAWMAAKEAWNHHEAEADTFIAKMGRPTLPTLAP